MTAIPRSVIAALLLGLLTACSSTPEVVIQKVYVPQEIDDGLLTCKAFPAKPPERPSYGGLLTLLAEAKAAWVDCSFKLSEIRALVKKPPARPPPS